MNKEDGIYAMRFASQQMLIDKLQQENKQLKIQISAREEVCNRLESNWNKLKEYLNYKSERAVGEDEYVYDEIYNEMQEMEKNYGNN